MKSELTTITFKIPVALKAQLQSMCTELGLTTTTALILMIRGFLRSKKLNLQLQKSEC